MTQNKDVSTEYVDDILARAGINPEIGKIIPIHNLVTISRLIGQRYPVNDMPYSKAGRENMPPDMYYFRGATFLEEVGGVFKFQKGSGFIDVSMRESGQWEIRTSSPNLVAVWEKLFKTDKQLKAEKAAHITVICVEVPFGSELISVVHFLQKEPNGIITNNSLFNLEPWNETMFKPKFSLDLYNSDVMTRTANITVESSDKNWIDKFQNITFQVGSNSISESPDGGIVVSYDPSKKFKTLSLNIYLGRYTVISSKIIL